MGRLSLISPCHKHHQTAQYRLRPDTHLTALRSMSGEAFRGWSGDVSNQWGCTQISLRSTTESLRPPAPRLSQGPQPSVLRGDDASEATGSRLDCTLETWVTPRGAQVGHAQLQIFTRLKLGNL